MQRLISFFLINVCKAFFVILRSMNARLSIPAKSGVFPQASILWESSGAEEGLGSSGEPGTPAAALGLL